MDPRWFSIPLIASTLVASGCQGWPTFANKPDLSGQQPVGTDLSTLLDIDWFTIDDIEPADDEAETTVGARTLEASFDEGAERAWIISGALTGTGWGEAIPKVKVGCDGSDELPRSPVIPMKSGGTDPELGDYTGDVDPLIITVPDDATLCMAFEADDAAVVAASERFGWDLLTYPVNSCGAPTDAPKLDAEEKMIGVGGGGATGAWRITVPADGAQGMLFSGYYPSDATLEIPYRVAYSVLRNGPDGSPSVCPPFPSADGDYPDSVQQ